MRSAQDTDVGGRSPSQTPSVTPGGLLRRRRPAPPDSGPSSVPLGYVALLLLGLLLRLAITRTAALGHFNSDQAVVYLMGLHASRGDFSLLFWSQAYGGTIEPLLLGLLIAVFGEHDFLLPLLDIALAMTAIVLWARVAQECFGVRVGRLTGIGLALGPASWIWWNTHDGGYYNAALVFAAAASLASLRISSGRWRVAMVLLTAGAVYSMPLALATLAPAIWQSLQARRSRVAIAGFWLAGLVLGSLPTVYALSQGRGAVGVGAPRSLASLISAWEQVLPGGILTFSTLDSRPFRTGLALLIVGLLASGISSGLQARRASIGALGALLVWLCLFFVAGLATDDTQFRYAFFLLPALVAAAVVRLPTRFDAAALLMWSLLTIAALSVATGGFPFDKSPNAPQDYRQLAALLEREQVRAGFGDYWLAYRVTALTNEQTVLDGIGSSRYEPYRAAAEAAPQRVYVLYRNGPNAASLNQRPDLFARPSISVGRFTVFFIRQNATPLPAFVIAPEE